LRLVTDLVMAINPKIAKSKPVIAPITLLAFGAINWTYTWYDPEGALSLDHLAELTEKFLIEGLRGI